jgi:hypothetical protein
VHRDSGEVFDGALNDLVQLIIPSPHQARRIAMIGTIQKPLRMLMWELR